MIDIESLDDQAVLPNLRPGEEKQPIPGSEFFCFLSILVLLAFAYSTRNSVFLPVFDALENYRWLQLLEKPSILWIGMGSLTLSLRTFLWFRYAPFPAAGFAEAPRLSIIIPAYNEGPLVLRSIESAAQADYPREKLEIFVIDDGSRDDTWSHIQTAAARYPGLITAVRFEKNQGKRAAVAYGFRRALGEVFVTIDSDSTIKKDALLLMAGPFRDPMIGAVAGKLLALNKDANIFSSMLHVYYVLESDLVRAAQSVYRTVGCCPGALAAYRAAPIRKIVDEWEHQTFLGKPCHNGEDRSITNLLMRDGYDSVYQRTAQVHTLVPTTYDKLCRMFLRWERGTIREEILFSRIVWKRPWRVRWTALYFYFMRNLAYPIGYAATIFMLYWAWHAPGMLIRFFTAVTLMSLFEMLFYLDTDKSWSFLYGIAYAYFHIFALFWIYPYALLTVRSTSWMTR